MNKSINKMVQAVELINNLQARAKDALATGSKRAARLLLHKADMIAVDLIKVDDDYECNDDMVTLTTSAGTFTMIADIY